MATMTRGSEPSPERMRMPHEWRTALATVAAIGLAGALVIALLIALMRNVAP
jgi:hypothetical protein